MENRFLELDPPLGATRVRQGRAMHGNGGAHAGRSAALSWSRPMSAADRALVIMIENGGIDLGIPDLVDKLLSSVPGADLLPEGVRRQIVDFVRAEITKLTDNLLETVELTANRYEAAKPSLFGDVIVLRDSTASYADLKGRLHALTGAGKIVDLFILTHGNTDFISVTGGIDGAKIRAMRAELGKPLSIRSVYMMNCVGSTLNQAWLDAGAKVSSGSIRNNYLPEPTMFFFWEKWKAGEGFESAATSAYRRTINLMNDSVRGFIDNLPFPGTSDLAKSIDFAAYDFVRDSAPIVQGSQRNLTVSSDDLSFTQSRASALATTVLPVGLLRALGDPVAAPAGGRPSRTVSPAGLDLIKSFEGFRAEMYNDPVGHCTIGYGTLLHKGNCDARPVELEYSGGITEARATELLTQRVTEFQQVINDQVSVPLNQNQNDALVSLVYNIGGEAFQRSTLLRVLNEARYDTVPGEIRKWTKARENGQLVELPGLVRRRGAEADLFARPVASEGAAAQSLSWLAGAFAAVDYTIPGHIEPLKQSAPKTCWATVITMMDSWRRQQSLPVATVLAAAGQEWVDRYQRGEILSPEHSESLYTALGLVPIRSFNPTIEGWETLLRQYGPLYVDVGYGQSAMTHAIIVTGITGDGTAAGTTIKYIDPAGGTRIDRPFAEFITEYESPGAVNNWPWTIVHWPPPQPSSGQQSLPVRHSYSYQTGELAYQQNPVLIAGITVGEAAQIGLGAISVVQAQVSASQGSFSLSYDKAQRLLTTDARAKMPGSQTTKRSYTASLLNLSIAAIAAAEADVIIEWEGSAYGEIGTPVIRRRLETSTEWSKSSANITIIKVDRIPAPGTDPRSWPITYSYEGTYDPWGNGYFEFTGEFEINAFGGLKFNRHQVVSRSIADFAIGGTPEGKVARGPDVIVPVPEIPADQVELLRTMLP